MTQPRNLPDWVIELIAGLDKYSTEHPTLRAQFYGSDVWQKADCSCGLLKLVPNDVRSFASGWAIAKERFAPSTEALVGEHQETSG